MLPALLFLAAAFAVLFVARLGAARRTQLVQRWPALLLGAGAVYALARGALWLAALLVVAAAIAWVAWPRPQPAPSAPRVREERAVAEARAILGVPPDATEAEIRTAYRTKMARAHPDRGGRHADAARLTAARDRLIRKRK